MHTEANVENNCVNIIGIIVEECVFSHKVYGEGFYSFKVSVDRLSDNADILPVMVSERLIDKEVLKIGEKVEVLGQLRSYNNYENNRSKLVLTVFARDIHIVEDIGNKNSNQIYLNGFICKQPVYRETPLGREIADILVAVNRAYNKSDYIPCIAWGRNAKFVSKLSVGDNIKVRGRIQSRAYSKKSGEVTEERVAYEVSISKIEFDD